MTHKQAKIAARQMASFLLKKAIAEIQKGGLFNNHQQELAFGGLTQREKEMLLEEMDDLAEKLLGDVIGFNDEYEILNYARKS